MAALLASLMRLSPDRPFSFFYPDSLLLKKGGCGGYLWKAVITFYPHNNPQAVGNWPAYVGDGVSI
jgi:hypothetical protein